jgi:hypothetical protein
VKAPSALQQQNQAAGGGSCSGSGMAQAQSLNAAGSLLLQRSPSAVSFDRPLHHQDALSYSIFTFDDRRRLQISGFLFLISVD